LIHFYKRDELQFRQIKTLDFHGLAMQDVRVQF